MVCRYRVLSEALFQPARRLVDPARDQEPIADEFRVPSRYDNLLEHIAQRPSVRPLRCSGKTETSNGVVVFSNLRP